WQAVAIIITAYGFVAQAICILVGPVFILFFIVPKLEWLFWGWLQGFMQYAFYQVIAAATMFVMGNLVIYVLTQPPFLPVPDPASLLTLLIVVFLGGIYALLKVPALTSHIFSGMSGLSSTDVIEYFMSCVIRNSTKRNSSTWKSTATRWSPITTSRSPSPCSAWLRSDWWF